ncbi:hypothetical protein OTU49_009789, partial [Cherax quadricarinatus]
TWPQQQHTPTTSIIASIFHGIKESVIFCLEKKRIASIANECFDNLSLDVMGDGERSLEELMKNHLRPQMVNWDCQHCRSPHQCAHYTSILRLPQVLPLHLTRQGGCQARVTFPAVNFSLPTALARKVDHSRRYELVSVCVQQQQGMEGSSGSHYTAFCRSKESGRWWLWDDIHLHPANINNVLTAQHPHLIFYEAI